SAPNRRRSRAGRRSNVARRDRLTRPGPREAGSRRGGRPPARRAETANGEIIIRVAGALTAASLACVAVPTVAWGQQQILSIPCIGQPVSHAIARADAPDGAET